jgi:hypothetical protein
MVADCPTSTALDMLAGSDPTPHHTRAETWIKVASGRRFYPYAPRLVDIRIHDIAHSLAKLERFNGHLEDIDTLYSVGQHSCHVHDLVVNPRAKFWALMHDSPEYVIGDKSSPLKEWDPEYRKLEENLASAIRERFQIPYDAEIHRAVKDVDNWIGFQEGKQKLFNSEVEVWQAQVTRPTSFQREDFAFPVWTARRARDEFLDRFFMLTQGVV